MRWWVRRSGQSLLGGPAAPTKWARAVLGLTRAAGHPVTAGNVVGEAMASGLPVVAAAAGGVPSVIGRPGETGILFPPGDAEAAANSIKQLMRDPEGR